MMKVLPQISGLERVLTILLALVNLASFHQISEDLVVHTNKGKIRGFDTKVPHSSRELSAFYGIPYAQPPTGKLRFRHPRPLEPWEGVLDANEKPNACMQIKDTMFPGFSGSEQWNPHTKLSEDCLYINVVVPKPYHENSAVMVWIHGGGFFSGSSSLDMYDMRTIAAEENIVMVSIQYRVASLGFLFFDTEDVPGNAGMFDQIMALQWIKDNIDSFGGNPNNITLVGNEAGAACISLHLLSPLSRNLFSQAIMQSASVSAPWAVITKEEAFLRGLRLAELMKCPFERTHIQLTIECLQSADAYHMLNNEWNGIVNGLVIGIFVPIIDGAFLEEKPSTALQNRNFKTANILMGSNQNEGLFFLFYYLPEMFELKEDVYISREQFQRAVAELNTYFNPLQCKAIEFEYTNWINPRNTVNNRLQTDQLTGDWQFTCPGSLHVVEFAHRYAETGNNVYMYYFTQKSTVSAWPKWSGALNGDEIHFVFGQPLNKTYGYSEEEIRLSKKMMTFWANFAKTGHPSLIAGNTWTDDYWPLHTPFRRETLLLDAKKNDLEVLENDEQKVKKCVFWNKFLPQLVMPTPNKPSMPTKLAMPTNQDCVNGLRCKFFETMKIIRDSFCHA